MDMDQPVLSEQEYQRLYIFDFAIKPVITGVGDLVIRWICIEIPP